MPVHDFNKAGKFADRGCVSCGDGSLFSPDQVLGVAETFSKNILSKTLEQWEGPSFPIKNVPTKASMAVQPNAITNRMSVFWPNLERQKWYDPVPTLATKQVTKELIDKSGGIEGLDYNYFEGSGLACNPPMGPRALAGKDAGYSSEVWTTFLLGPICTAKYRVLEDLIMYMSAAEAGIGQAIDVSLQYEKINQFVQMSRKNATAVAGTWQPKFTEHVFGEFPDSPGSLEWIIYTASIIGSRFPGMQPVRVCCSVQLLQWWILDFVQRHEGQIQINLDFRDIRGAVRGYNTSFTQEGEFAMRDARTGRQIIFDTSKTPCYQLLNKRGQYEWERRHQPYFVYREGDDTREGEMNGVMQDPNPHLGDADQIHEDGSVLAELIMIYADDAFHYEAPPLNPFAGKFERGAIMPTIGTTQINWYTGVEVDTYFLQHMTDPTTGQCPNNRAKQWIAGEASTHLVIRENNKYAMGSILVQVPSTSTPLGAAPDKCLAAAARPAPIELSTAQPIPPDHCATAPEAPEDVAGCLVPQLILNVYADGSDEKTVKVTIERQGGFDGELEVDYTFVAGTALAGTHYTDDSGTITFAEGERVKQLEIEILPYLKEDEEDIAVQFQIVWDGDLCNPFGGATGYEDESETDAATMVTIWPAKPAYDNTPGEADLDCEPGEIAE